MQDLRVQPEQDAAPWRRIEENLIPQTEANMIAEAEEVKIEENSLSPTRIPCRNTVSKASSILTLAQSLILVILALRALLEAVHRNQPANICLIRRELVSVSGGLTGRLVHTGRQELVEPSRVGGLLRVQHICVAKYGQKWVRTRTIVDSFNPKLNEQYIWEAFDPSTVITIGVFDNGHIHGGDKGGKDSRIGKVRIRLSTLETDIVYTHLYPLLVLHPSGVKKMGEIQLALDSLRHQAMKIVSMRLNRARESSHNHFNSYPLYYIGSLSGTNSSNYFSLPILDWNLELPVEAEAPSSHGHTAISVDEEFDTFPTSRPLDIVRMRYDRLRSIAGRVKTFVDDLATQGERFQSLLSWRDPRATTLFVTFCLIAAIVLYVTPFQVVAFLAGIYVLRHPRFRHKLPSVPLNFFRRLPARSDSML
ncbi:hypothetical protein ACFX1T_005569 [Malus domestica]